MRNTDTITTRNLCKALDTLTRVGIEATFYANELKFKTPFGTLASKLNFVHNGLVYSILGNKLLFVERTETVENFNGEYISVADVLSDHLALSLGIALTTFETLALNENELDK